MGPIGLAVLTFIGYKKTDKQTNKQANKQADRQAKFMYRCLRFKSKVKTSRILLLKHFKNHSGLNYPLEEKQFFYVFIFSDF